jgi:hypothetical protein
MESLIPNSEDTRDQKISKIKALIADRHARFLVAPDHEKLELIEQQIRDRNVLRLLRLDVDHITANDLITADLEELQHYASGLEKKNDPSTEWLLRLVREQITLLIT